MSRFYTTKGDDGTTGLLGAERAYKDDPRLEAVGALDEASAAFGVARAASQAQGVAALALAIQRDLYGLMAEAAATPENAARFRVIDAGRVAWLEAHIEQFSQAVAMPQGFIVPGDSAGGAAMAVARTVVRRAERRVVTLRRAGGLENPDLQRYLNRLSSLCFVLELLENQAAGQARPTMAEGE